MAGKVGPGAQSRGVSMLAAQLQAEKPGAGQLIGLRSGVLVPEGAVLFVMVRQEVRDRLVNRLLRDRRAIQPRGTERHEGPTAA